jgi:hypothetical protein
MTPSKDMTTLKGRNDFKTLKNDLLAAVKFSQMDNEELEFENRKKKIEAFKTELKALMKKYNFGKHESDKYNGMEEYCGTDYYFTVDGETWYGETIAEILDEVVGSH